MDIIEEFSAARGIILDDFQVQACQALLDGRSVLVAAPTGSGKTIVADFSAYIASVGNSRIIYTTPIKALSNQKYLEFCALYGEANVGLATGDRSIRPRARVVIMTTEVLRNIIYTDLEALDNVSHVVLDEVHYISDRSRGAVWEEVIIQLPLTVDLVCLSATVSNAEEVAQWLTTVRGSTEAIIHEQRPIPLTYWFSFRKRKQAMQIYPLLSGSQKEMKVHPDLYRAMRPGLSKKSHDNFLAPRRLDLIEYLDGQNMLPAIFFIFSRAGCDDALRECFNTHMQLTSSQERKEIREICDRHLDGLSDDEFSALEYDLVVHAMERGFAPHHAGLIPPLREAVEEAFIAGLIKVVFATETLAVGVNMPAKSVVIEKLTKYNGDHHDVLTPGEFTQLTGRAGRRGIDIAGHAFVVWNRFVDFEQAASLASTRTYALRSSFRPTYNMATNLISAYSPAHARHILNLSLAQFQADDAVVTLERNLATKQSRMEDIRKEFSQTDRQFQTLVHKRRTSTEKAPDYELYDVNDFFRTLHRGDVLDGFRHGEACVVVTKAQSRHDAYVRVIDVHGRVHTLAPGQIEGGVSVVAHFELPTPVAVRTKHFRVTTSIALRRALKAAPAKSKTSEDKDRSAKQKKLRETQLLDEYLACERDVARLTRRVHSRGQSLARQFERILSLLSEYEYVDDWSLTEKGRILSLVNTEADLVIAHGIESGMFEELNAAEFAGFLASVIFEARRDDGRVSKLPTPALEKLSSKMEDFVRILNDNEREAGLKESRGLDYAMCWPAYLWARGKSLEELIETRDIAGGDFVRAMKSVIDLARQISKAANSQVLIDLSEATIEACLRDIIVVSS